eukprot:11569214-Alexandrium_andersonii.AAC.1
MRPHLREGVPLCLCARTFSGGSGRSIELRWRARPVAELCPGPCRRSVTNTRHDRVQRALGTA